MIIGTRIEERIRVVGTTQAGLARAVGLHQTTINQLINNGGNSRYLHKIATELRTTPAYLTGETDDPEAEFPDELLTAEEREHLDLLQALEPADRKAVLQLIRSLASSARSSAVHAKQHEYRPS